jgi:DNA-binding CsgD family transcriptional regulator/tetratricopeptide (TPR) repeat protein
MTVARRGTCLCLGSDGRLDALTATNDHGCEMTVLPLVGRERELGALEDLVDGVGDHGGALVLCGEPGIGKSALLAMANRHATDRGMQVLAATGVQSEAHLPFAGLHQLLRPIIAGAMGLPVRQRMALLAAFGMADVAAPDRFIIALAALELLADTAASGPVLVAVEDAQWLDRPTGDVLAFIARRLESEPIVLLAAVREGHASALGEAGLPELRLEGLDAAAADTLLTAHAPPLASRVRERLLAEAMGNPLALLELPVALGSDQLGEGALPEWLPLTARLERAFAARLSELSAMTRRLLLVAAVDHDGILAEVLAAAAILERTDTEVAVEALTPAVDARLVEIDELGVRFRHPLVRSAIHQAASFHERHAAHAALAQVLVDQPDRRAWHRAASVVGPDETVAGELEELAARAQRRGGLGVAAAALERAARLGEDPAGQGNRLLRAAELELELGRRDLVVGLLQEAEPLQLAEVERRRMLWLREMLDPSSLGDAAKLRSMVDAAARVAADGDQDLAVNLLWRAAQRCFWGDPGQQARDQVLAATERLHLDDGDPRLLAILAYVAPVERGRVIIDRLSRLASDVGGDAQATGLLGTAAMVVGAFDLAAGFLAAASAGLRAQGRLGHLARLRTLQAWSAVYLADWKGAMPAAEEASQLAAETREPLWAASAQVVKAMLAGLRGEREVADTLAAHAEQAAYPIGARFLLAIAQLSRGLAALGVGRHDDAYEHLGRVFDRADVAYHPFTPTWALSALPATTPHSGHRDAARAVLEELEPLAAQTPSSWFQAGMSYARPLLADDQDAEPLFQAALDSDLVRWPLLRPRLLLAYGVWLRRQRRVAESRAPLRAARDSFDAIGAIPWGERARQELRASGEASHRPSPQAWDQLSPQELQIAQLAADGFSNREIGQQLYLSHRTVSSYLYRVFPKLGISSRSQLRAVLDRGTS